MLGYFHQHWLIIVAMQYVIGTFDCSDVCTSLRLLISFRTVCLRVTVGEVAKGGSGAPMREIKRDMSSVVG